MADFLSNLVTRNTGNTEALRPRPLSIYEARPYTQPVAGLGSPAVRDLEDRPMDEFTTHTGTIGRAQQQETISEKNRAGLGTVVPTVSPVLPQPELPSGSASAKEAQQLGMAVEGAKSTRSLQTRSQDVPANDRDTTSLRTESILPQISAYGISGTARADVSIASGSTPLKSDQRKPAWLYESANELIRPAASEPFENEQHPTLDKFARPHPGMSEISRGRSTLHPELRIAAASQASASHRSSEPPTVHVSIGRIEVRLVNHASQVTPSVRTHAPVMTLEEYLHQRDGGQR